MPTLADLEKIKAQTLEKMGCRESSQKIKITIGMGTCGIAAGAREVMLAIMDEVAKRNLKDVIISQTGCIGMCAQEPLVEVEIPGKAKVMYGKINAQKARQIVAQHVVNGIAINEWLVK